MSKYKVGDRVRVRSDLVAGRSYGCVNFVVYMEKFKGKIYKITDYDFVSRSYHLNSKGFKFVFTDEMLEPATDYKIVITSDGKETTARLYDGKKVIKTATAKCHDDDEFDFEEGSKIAFERLFEEPEFKVGDLVVFTNNELHAELPRYYPKVGTVGKIIDFSKTYKDVIRVNWEHGSTTGGDEQSSNKAFVRKVNL